MESSYILATELVLTNEIESLLEKRRLLELKLGALADVKEYLDQVPSDEKLLWEIASATLEKEKILINSQIMAAEVAKGTTRRYMLERANALGNYPH